MPVVVREDGLTFVIHTRELPFEPPHVHVFLADGRDVRIALLSGTLLDLPPVTRRRAILEAFGRHLSAIRQMWQDIHGPLPGDLEL